MKSSQILVKTDEKLKKDAKKLAGDLGFTLTAVINALMKQFVREKGLNVSLQPKITETLMAELDEINSDITNNVNMSKEYDDVHELLADLKQGK